MNQKAFTLIELLVVVAIIGILAAVGTPIFQGFIEDAKCSATNRQFNQVRDVIQMELASCLSLGSWKSQQTYKLNKYKCNSGWSDYGYFGKMMGQHFHYDGWKNPHGAVALPKGSPYYAGITDRATLGWSGAGLYVATKSSPVGVIWITGSKH
jgi:prepilin-type N-terminal cleavage/methylation domain